MTPDKETLRPCPFCGEFNIRLQVGVGCRNDFCSAQGPMFSDKDIGLDKWNSAYCWKELDSFRAENEKLKEENEGQNIWIGRLEADLEEQCLLLGKSGSREAQLLTRIGELEECLHRISDEAPKNGLIRLWCRLLLSKTKPPEGEKEKP